ncbi:MAG: hypothetical protein DMG31_07570 [Acidobacteria bacterium]|nr:MAG: hypothetical protein DMG31_07570 [Acidobacteriota bacterium]
MKLPEYAPSTSDRASTREELFEVLEVLGGFDEPQDAEFSQTSELLASPEAEPTVSPVEILDAVTTGEEQLLIEIGAFNSLLERKAERIN